MRKLASIQRIKSLEPIKGADAIEKAQVLGWQLVVKKGEFQVGDLCVYCEIDCIMPDRPEFEFLKSKKMRVKTIKLRGQVSQGICFPLSILPTTLLTEEGTDVTELLGVEKYEAPIPASLSGVMKREFPSFIPKTDETRVQVLQEFLDKYQGATCYFTEKLDGSSTTIYLKDDDFGLCSRNLELIEDDKNSMWKLARELKIEEKLRALGKNYALQAEIVGEGIQKNTLNIRGQKLFFFNIFDIDAYKYLDFQDFMDTMKKLELETVPVLTTDYVLENDIEKLVEMATRRSVINPKAWCEGIVIRSLKEQFISGERFSFKVINPKFLLKYDA